MQGELEKFKDVDVDNLKSQISTLTTQLADEKKAREKDAGWRIDYFVVSERWKEKIEDAIIYKTVMGSDHCPIGLQMK